MDSMSSTSFKTMEEMASKLRLSKSTLSRYCEKGLPHLRVSTHHFLFEEQEVINWITSRGNGNISQPNQKFDYRNVLIAPLIGQESVEWYNGQNSIKPGSRMYVTNPKAAKHVYHISYFAPIINKQITEIDVVVGVTYEQLAPLGYNGYGPVLTLEKGFTLNRPIVVPSRSGPGYSINCLDLMLNNQGQPLSAITALKKNREATFPIV
jgi:hypothetical protein